jgi:hypothetical protein
MAPTSSTRQLRSITTAKQFARLIFAILSGRQRTLS